MLKAMFNHILRNPEDLRASEGPSADPDSQKNHLQVPEETPEGNGVFRDNIQLTWNHSLMGFLICFVPSGEFLVLDFGGGSKESNTDDDMDVDGDIDMRRLLSSSQMGGEGSGPDLSRQLMTHLRLLQADLQYLKVSEAGQPQLCSPRTDVWTVT